MDDAEAERMDAVIRSLEPHHPEAEVEVSGGIVRPPMIRSSEVASLYETARQIATEELGFDHLGETKSGGGSDGSFCADVGVPTLDGLGAVGQGAHAAHEQVVVEHLPKRAALLARMIQEI